MTHLPGTFTRHHHVYFYISVQIGLLFDISLSLHVLSSVSAYRTEKRRTVRRTALNNIIAETSLPVTQYDTSFETLINTRQHAIEDIVRDALQQHGYRRVCSSIVCFSIVVNR